MENLITAKQQTQWMAGTVAVLGTLLTIGGPMMLAEHYAQNGVSEAAYSNYAAEQTQRAASPDIGTAATATVFVRQWVGNS